MWLYLDLMCRNKPLGIKKIPRGYLIIPILVLDMTLFNII